MQSRIAQSLSLVIIKLEEASTLSTFAASKQFNLSSFLKFNNNQGERLSNTRLHIALREPCPESDMKRKKRVSSIKFPYFSKDRLRLISAYFCSPSGTKRTVHKPVELPKPIRVNSAAEDHSGIRAIHTIHLFPRTGFSHGCLRTRIIHACR